jgi:anti-sigma B factor antagonist
MGHEATAPGAEPGTDTDCNAHMAKITIEVKPGGRSRAVRVVTISGEVDAHTFPELQETLERLVREGHTNIVVECAGLDYISSAGLGVLKQKAFELRASGGDIRLASLPEKIETIMSLLGFTKLLRTFPDVRNAVSSYSGRLRKPKGS